MRSTSAQKVYDEIVSTHKKALFEQPELLQSLLEMTAQNDGAPYVVPDIVTARAKVEIHELSDGSECVIMLPKDASADVDAGAYVAAEAEADVGADADADNVFLFYLHGGGFAIDMSDDHWELLLALFEELNCPIVVPIYPLAPLHTSGEVYQSVLYAYCFALERFKGKMPVVIGDSAGGHLVIALTQMILQAGVKRPALDIALSPWIDPAGKLPGKEELESIDPMLAMYGLNHIGAIWSDEENLIHLPGSDTESGAITDDAPVSISTDLVANGFEGFPPTYIYTGELEILSIDSQVLAQAIEEAGGRVTLTIQDGLWHTYPLFPQTDEAQEARAEMVNLIQGLS